MNMNLYIYKFATQLLSVLSFTTNPLVENNLLVLSCNIINLYVYSISITSIVYKGIFYACRFAFHKDTDYHPGMALAF